MNTGIQKATGGLSTTESLTGITHHTEQTAATVLAARAKAEVEARLIIAMQRPRNWMQVRTKLLEAIERPGFASDGWGSGWWQRPIGKGDHIEGFSIRFAEECLRCMGNMDARSSVIFEDEHSRIILVEVIDLESNISIPTTINLEKTVERTYLKRGEVAISERVNSYGKKTYLRRATEEEVLQKQGSAISKAMRNGILRLLPGDIQSECRQRILEIRHGEAAKDPKAFGKKVADSFAQLNIHPEDLEELIGQPLGTCSPEQLGQLRDLYKAIRDGETTWAKVLQAQEGKEEEQATGSSLDDLTKTMAKKQGKGGKGRGKGKKGAKQAKEAPKTAPEEQEGDDQGYGPPMGEGEAEEPPESPQRDGEGRLL